MIMIKKENYLMNKGITLVEVLVAVAVFAIGILAILGMFSLGNKIARTSQSQTIASNLAQEKMEENIFKGYGGVSDDSEDYNTISGFGSFKRETVVTCFDPNGSDLPDCSESEDATGIKKIEVTVFWKNRERAKLDTLISKH